MKLRKQISKTGAARPAASRGSQRLFRHSLVCLMTVVMMLFSSGCAAKNDAVRFAVSQSVPYQILAYMVQILAEQEDVEMRMIEVDGGAADIQPALASGSLDGTVEFSQSAWRYVLKKKGVYTGDKLSELEDAYAKMSLQWFPISMVVDHYTLAVRHDVVYDHNLKTLSGLSRVSHELVFGADSEYFQREDGFPRLNEIYQFDFRTIENLPSDGLYDFLIDDRIQAMPVHSLSGYLDEEEMFQLEDDLKAYPDSTAGLIFSDEILDKYPILADIAWQISGTLNTDRLRHLVRLVDKGDIDAQEAALIACKGFGWIEEEDQEAGLETKQIN